MYLEMKSGAVVASGKLHKDPKVQTFGEKTKVTFGIKADRRKTESGQWDTKWANCAAWDDTAKDAAALREGMSVIVTGRVQKREYNGRIYEDINVDAIAVCGVPLRSVDELKTNFPQAVKEGQGVFAETDDDGELPFE